MQRRLRNTLAIAIAGAAVIIGAGTAAAASPADDVTGSAPQLASPSDHDGPSADNSDEGKPSADSLPAGGLGSAQPDLGSATNSLPTGGLGNGVQAPLGGVGN